MLPDLTGRRRIHVVGVGGAGMSAIASVLAAMGHQVRGSDLKRTATTERLAADGVEVLLGHDAAHVGDVDLVTASPAVRPDNAELAEAGRRGIQISSRAEVLAAIARLRRCIAVAGTHGKTTTASMLALVLVEAGMRPSFLIGADVNEIGTNAVWDEGEWLVIEADESYGTFRHLTPEIVAVTNVEADHLDHYGTLDAVERAFGAFLGSASGARVVWADDPGASRLGRQVGALTVGTAGADVVVTGMEHARSAVRFRLTRAGAELGTVDLPIPGAHNAANAALAAVTALEAGASFEAVHSALARFAGVPRRFEFRGAARGVTFVDDYAHLPTEVRAALTTGRQGGWDRVVAVFQPHRYTRTAALADAFGDAFGDADVVVVTDVYAAGEPVLPGVSGRLVADAVSARRPPEAVIYVAARDDLVARVSAILAPGDLCLTLGAGDLTSLPDELLAAPRW